MCDFGTRLGEGIAEAVDDLLCSIQAGPSALWLENHKFISETLVATALVGSPAALELNRKLGNILFSPALEAILIRNPKRVTMYALPLIFLTDPPPGHALAERLFRHFHEADGTKATSYPAFRNREIDYVYENLHRRPFHHDPFEHLCSTFPWLNRAHVYGLTHLHFYNSDFCRRHVSYPQPGPAIVDALLAKASFEGDHDLAVELMLCYISMGEVEPGIVRFYDYLLVDLLRNFVGADGKVLINRPFRDTYHLLILAWVYIALRGDDFSPQFHPAENGRIRALGAMICAMSAGDFVAFFGDYSLYIDEFGPSPIIENVLPLYADLVGAAMSRASTKRRHPVALPGRAA